MSEEEVKKPGNEEQEVESVHQGIVDARGKRTSPWAWVSTLYFAEGIPYILAMMVSVVMYKRLGISNAKIAYWTSILYLPWALKPIWSPIVDIFKTKRWWIVVMQLLLAIFLGAVALVLPLPNFFSISVAFLLLVAFSSSTHDIAADGFYMLGLTKHQQAWFVGVRSTFYRFAMLTGQGLLVIFAGYLEANTGLESVEMKVNAVVESKPKADYYQYTGISEEKSAELADIPGLEKLRFYLQEAEETDNVDVAATMAYLADKTVTSMRKQENIEKAKIDKAQEILDEVNLILERFMQDEAQKLNASVEPLEDELRIVTKPDDLEIPIQTMPANDAAVTMYAIEHWNLLQGQPEQKEAIEKKKEKGPVKKAWNKIVAGPVRSVLIAVFGEREDDYRDLWSSQRG